MGLPQYFDHAFDAGSQPPCPWRPQDGSRFGSPHAFRKPTEGGWRIPERALPPFAELVLPDPYQRGQRQWLRTPDGELRAPHDKLRIAPRLMQQGGRLQCRRAGAHDRYTATPELAESVVIRCM